MAADAGSRSRADEGCRKKGSGTVCEMEYYAHTDGTQDTRNWQPLREHLRNVAEKSRDFATEARPNDAEFAEAAYAAGLLHDLGKYRREFQEMIRNKRQKSDATRHKQMGAQYALDKGRRDLPFAIMGHHGGIPNIADLVNDGNAVKAVVNEIFSVAAADFSQLAMHLPAWGAGFAAVDVDIRVRLLFSCLVDADWSDTSDFQSRRMGWPVPPLPPTLEAAPLLNKVLSFIAQRAGECRNLDLARIRAEVLAAALESGSRATGIFSMTVPTGGGKTLSSLAFALAHAAANKLRRVIYVAPYLSIIEQNANVFRTALGDSAENMILEHHSLAEPGRGEKSQADNPESEAAQRLAENWDAPVVLTTSMQFYESLFSNRPGRCRKLHNIARSVVILDECQTLNPSLSGPTCQMLEQMVGFLGCTVVLCTATQPAWKKDDDIFPCGLREIHEMIPAELRLFDRLKRVEAVWPGPDLHPTSWPDIAEQMVARGRAACVVNTRKAARDLYNNLRKAGGTNVFHLSTSMCPAHRLTVLDRLKKLLVADEDCLLVSTQLIEAGVDIDFPFMLRELAPLESIVQAAGRCNREGLLDQRGNLVVFKSVDGGLPQDNWYRNGTAVVEQHFIRAGNPPDIHDPAHLAEYYRRLYPAGSTDSEGIIPLRNRFGFRDVAEHYRLINEGTSSVLISNWEPARETVDRLVGEIRQNPSRRAYRQLQRYSINVYEHELRQMINNNVVEMDYLPGLNRCDLPYDGALGLVFEGAAAVPAF